MTKKSILSLLLLWTMAVMNLSAGVWDTDYKLIEQNIKAPEFANRSFLITKYGAKTTASARQNQTAINKAIAACSKAGGGRVVVPAGKWNTGAITLKSNVNLVIEKDATLLFAFANLLFS